MRNVSQGFLEASLSPIGYATAYIEVGQTRIDASNLTDITITEDIGDGGAFSIGTLNTTEVSITAVSEAVESLDLTQPIKVYFGYLVGNDYEYVPMGVFYSEPRDISHKNLLTVIRAHDKSWALTSPYASALDFTSAVYVNNVLAEIQTDLGITYGTYGGLNPAYVRVYEAPEGSYRDVLAQMALLIGTNAKFNRSGNLDFIKADPSATPVQSYGAFDYASEDYTLTSNEPMRIGKLTTNYTYAVGDEEVTDTYVYGSGDHGLTIDSVDIRSQAETNTLGQEVLGNEYAYYGYSVGLPGQPQLDLGDVIELTEPLGDQYTFVIMSMIHNFNGAMKSTLSAVISMEDPKVDGQNISGSIKDTVIEQGRIIRRVGNIAENTNQYFWHTETGTDTGAHITEKTKEEFLDDPQNGGGNLLARSNGIAVRDGLEELAIFGADGTRIGTEESGHSVITNRAIQYKYGNDFIFRAYVSNDAQGLVNDATVTSTVGDGDVINLDIHIVQMTSVKYDDDTPITNYTISADGYSVTVPSRDTTKAVILNFVSDSPFPHYVLGTFYSGETLGRYSFHQGRKNGAGQYASAMGYGNRARGMSSHAEGESNLITIDGYRAHAEGHANTVSTNDGHAEGDSNTVSGYNSHAEGYSNTVSGGNSHAEGQGNTVSGNHAHAEGYENEVSGNGSHAEGIGNTVSGINAHAGGDHTIAQGDSQFVIGSYNVAQGTNQGWVRADNAFIIGNGTSESSRSNAFAVTWGGDVYINSNKLEDYVVARLNGSTAGTWYYIAYHSGISEAWGRFQETTGCTTSDAGGYRSTGITPANFPTVTIEGTSRALFSQVTTVTASATGVGANVCWPIQQSNVTATGVGKWALFRNTSNASAKGYINFHVKGRWK